MLRRTTSVNDLLRLRVLHGVSFFFYTISRRALSVQHSKAIVLLRKSQAFPQPQLFQTCIDLVNGLGTDLLDATTGAYGPSILHLGQRQRGNR